MAINKEDLEKKLIGVDPFMAEVTREAVDYLNQLGEEGWKLLNEDPLKAYHNGRLASDPELIRKAGWELLKRGNPSEAYWAGKETGDTELMDKARPIFLEKDPFKAYEAGRMAGDIELIKGALAKGVGDKILEEKPLEAYFGGKDAGDIELMKKARSKLLLEDPLGAYIVAMVPDDEITADDKEYIRKVGWALLEKDPSKAYRAARKAGDIELIKRTLAKGLRKELLKEDPSEAYEAGKEVNDVDLMRKAERKLRKIYRNQDL